VLTTLEFLKLLEQVRDQFDWTLTADTGPYAERRARSRFHLQASPTTGPSLSLSPIQAVYYARTGEIFGPARWPDAAEALGMDLSDAAAVVAAAGDRTWTGGDGQRNPEAGLLGIRRRLLETVGLVEHQDEDLTQPRPA
jgi:hypothetical protein